MKGCNMQNKHKHLDYIQHAITRMAKNSRTLKKMFLFSLMFISMLVALSAKIGTYEQICCLVCLVFALTVSFAYFDAFYLEQERIFIKKYNEVRHIPEDKIDFSMDTHYIKKEMQFCKSFFSVTVFYWYSPISLLYTALILTI